MRQGWRYFTLPVFAWSFYAASLWLWHMPPCYEVAARDWLVHLLEHLCFLVSGLVLWWTALVSARASALGVVAGIFLLFTTAVQDGLFGAFLVFSPRPLYGFYVEAAYVLGSDSLADQQLAGVFMQWCTLARRCRWHGASCLPTRVPRYGCAPEPPPTVPTGAVDSGALCAS